MQPVDLPQSVGKQSTPMASQQVNWAPGKPAPISSQNVKPGVQVLVLTDQNGEPTGSEAWVLISTPQDYPTAVHAFQDVVNAVAAWPREADPIAERAVLRASLEALAK
jgi:hypothetical protein